MALETPLVACAWCSTEKHIEDLRRTYQYRFDKDNLQAPPVKTKQAICLLCAADAGFPVAEMEMLGGSA